MRISLAAAALLAATTLSACADMQGNPNAAPYATDPGGVMAVKPEVLGMVSYDPYAKPAPVRGHADGPARNQSGAGAPLNMKPIR